MIVTLKTQTLSSLEQPRLEGWSDFLALGVEYILRGADHLLFVAALLIRGGGFWRLIAVITAFTVAHSFTLALAVLGVLTVPARVVERLRSSGWRWRICCRVVQTYGGPTMINQSLSYLAPRESAKFG